MVNNENNEPEIDGLIKYGYKNAQLKEIQEKLGRYIYYDLGYYTESDFRIYSKSEIISALFIKDMEDMGFQFINVSIDDSLRVYALFKFKECSGVSDRNE